MDIEQQQYQPEDCVAERTDEPTAEHEQHREDAQAHVGDYMNMDCQAAAAAHELAHAVAGINIYGHEKQHDQRQRQDDAAAFAAHHIDYQPATDEAVGHEMQHRRTKETVELGENRCEDTPMTELNVPDSVVTEASPATSVEPSHANLGNIVSDAMSDDAQTRFQAVQATRKLLQENKAPIDEVIESGILPPLVQCLTVDAEPQLQFEASWVLTNIVSGTSQQTQAVVQAGAVPLFLKLLNSPHSNVYEQAVWALGNIIVKSPQLRDQVIELGFVGQLLKFIKPEQPLSFLRNVTWAIRTVCRKQDPRLPASTVEELLRGLHQLIQNCNNDTEIIINSFWAVAYLAKAGNDYIQLVLDNGFVKHLVPLLGHTEQKVQLAAFRALKKIMAGSDDQKQVVLDEGALRHFRALIRTCNPDIVSKVGPILRNLTAGNHRHIQAVIDANLISYVVMRFQEDDDLLRVATQTIYNLAILGSDDQIRYLIPVLCRFLHCRFHPVKSVGLKSITKVLKRFACNDEELKKVKLQIVECGGYEKIVALHDDDADDIYELAYNILTKYFPESHADANSDDDD